MQGYEKRAMLAIAVTVVVIMIYSYFFMPTTHVNEQKRMSIKTTTTEISKHAISSEAGPLKRTRAVHFIKVQTPKYIMSISNVTGAINSLKLKKYRINDKLVNLVHPDSQYSMLETIFKSKKIEKIENNSVYTANKYSITLHQGSKSQILYLVKHKGNIKIIKKYAFYPNSYTIKFSVEVVKNAKLSKELFSLWLGPNIGNLNEKINSVALISGSIKKNKSIDNQNGNTEWCGIESKYFAFILLPSTNKYLMGGYFKQDKEKYVYDNATTPVTFKIYGGPKQGSDLVAVNKSLGKLVDFGMFGFLSKPLLSVLDFFDSFLGNYGLAIILLTFLIRLIFYPLSFKSFKSMREMGKLQPKLKELQNRYKGKADQLNKATMELYKQHKVNPFGGCLPIVIQIPVFIALYDALLSAIQLRGAPFYFWITDLSAKDPYYILPIIMGLTMFFQQKLTPTTMDPKQAKIMLFLPIIFTVMFLNFPSGLVLYWTVNNILTVVQMVFIDSKILDAQDKKHA